MKIKQLTGIDNVRFCVSVRSNYFRQAENHAVRESCEYLGHVFQGQELAVPGPPAAHACRVPGLQGWCGWRGEGRRWGSRRWSGIGRQTTEGLAGHHRTWDSILGNTESKQRLLGRGVTGSDGHFKTSHWLLCGEYTWGVREQTEDSVNLTDVLDWHTPL